MVSPGGGGNSALIYRKYIRRSPLAPRVLISDALSPAAVAIFEERGIEADFQPGLGKNKDKLASVIGGFDGLAIRSATKVTAKILERAERLKVIGRAGIGVDNVDIPATQDRERSVSGTVFHDGKPRIVAINGIEVDALVAPVTIYVSNEDKPGFIGRFASL